MHFRPICGLAAKHYLGSSTGAGQVVLAGPLAACGGGATIGDSFRENGLQRAAFEMQCPKDKIEVSGLNYPLEHSAEFGAQVGAQGCGKQTVYVMVLGAGWLANSASSSQPTEAPSAALGPSAAP